MSGTVLPGVQPDQITASYISTNFPAVAETLRAEARTSLSATHEAALSAARTAATAEATTNERGRIQAIYEAAMPGEQYVALRDTAVSSGQSPGDFALAQAKVTKSLGTDHMAALRADEEAARRAAAGVVVPPKDQQQGNGGAFEQYAAGTLEYDEIGCKAAWDAAKPAQRQEFTGNFKAYAAYCEANSKGLVQRKAPGAADQIAAMRAA